MEVYDMERVEYELQHQLQSGRIQSNNLANMQEYSLQGKYLHQFVPCSMHGETLISHQNVWGNICI